jgi:hypothetical protein
VRPAVFALIAIHVAARLAAAVQPVPADLAALTAKAHTSGTIAAWCRGEFRPGRPRGFAAAVAAASGGGRYVVFEADGTVEDLATFGSAASLSCYTRAEASSLDETIRSSDTIHGHVAPRWNTTVVCGFIDDTNALCWQYSPADRAFVKIGEWVT